MAGTVLAGTHPTPRDWTVHDDDTHVVAGENVIVLARYTAVNKTTASGSTSGMP
ncbi:hypothetical protein [Streptomyces sp. HUAS ZL42]|uniref:hypothetical protein n=1 Tax=Streptomyces sp. HUAS ZL42 TaxID=3231715 RepID=UPI00345E2D59